MTTFRLPDVGEGLTEAEIVAWHVGVGDHVVADQPLVSIETDKAVVEIPSPRAGHIAQLHGARGDVIAVGAALVEYADGAAEDVGAIVGDLPRAARATPAVRALAAARGVDLTSVVPTGPGGAVSGADVEAAASAAVEPLRGVRRAMAANMSRAHTQVVPATVTGEADIGDWPDGADPMLRLLRAVAAACAREPALNAAYLGRDRGRRMHDHVDIGIAVDTDDGLFAPVLRDVGNRDAEDLRGALDLLRADVETRTVAPEHLRGATISLSNFGAVGGRHAALVVVPPQVAILGAGRARDAVVARDGEVVIRRVLPLSLSFDHRVVMGGEAARFLNAVEDDLEKAT